MSGSADRLLDGVDLANTRAEVCEVAGHGLSSAPHAAGGFRTTALGAAMLAMAGLGIEPDISAAAQSRPAVEPRPDLSGCVARRHIACNALMSSLKPLWITLIDESGVGSAPMLDRFANLAAVRRGTA